LSAVEAATTAKITAAAVAQDCVYLLSEHARVVTETDWLLAWAQLADAHGMVSRLQIINVLQMIDAL
jgi:hypothetical protein